MAQIVMEDKTTNIEQRAKLLRGFADTSRLTILDALAKSPFVVQELVAHTGLTQPNISNHLRCLLECGLVASDRDGRFVRYRISNSRITTLLSDVDALLDVVAEGVEACDNYRET